VNPFRLASLAKNILPALLVLFFSCKEKTAFTVEDLQQLNGFWEIAKVIYPDGNKKTYTVNPTIDFIQIDGMKGYRKKVYPNLNGTYTATDDTQFFYIARKANKGFFITYRNNLTAWQEALVFLAKDKFYVVNKDGIIYRYRRYEPLEITQNGQATE